MEKEGNGPRAIVIMACDLWDKGAVLGSETRARCERALEEFEKYPGSRIVLMAGMADSKRYPRQTKSMADMMKCYLVNRGVTPSEITTTSNPQVWGSEEELQKAIHWIFLRDDCYGKRRDSLRFVDVTIISSDYHLKRLKFIVQNLMKNFGITGLRWNFKYVGIAGETKNRRVELFKYPLFVLKKLISRG